MSMFLIGARENKNTSTVIKVNPNKSKCSKYFSQRNKDPMLDKAIATPKMFICEIDFLNLQIIILFYVF